MKSTKSNFLLLLLASLTILGTLSCKNENEISASLKPITSTKPVVTPRQLVVGTWQLTEIAGGWSNTKVVPSKKAEMTIDSLLNVVFYEDDKVTSRYQFVLEQGTYGIGYSITKQIGEFSFLIHPRGVFKVSEKTLIVDNTATDGAAHSFQRK